MIDISSETLISLTDIPQHIPPKKNGKRVGLDAVYRWCRSGVHGVVLETLQCGGTKCTSLQALQRFFSKLSRPSERTDAAQTRCQRRRSVEADERELIAAGG